MPAGRRYRAPADDRAVLADPPLDAVPELVAFNRRRLGSAEVKVGGLPLAELRAMARREVLDAAQRYLAESGESPATAACGVDGPLLISGHQPELFHPGVWVKNFALNRFARQVGGTALNLVVDNDNLKSTAVRFPVWDGSDPADVHLHNVPFDRFDGEAPFEDRTVRDAEQFRTFAERAAPSCRNWGYEPLLPRVWADVVAHPSPVIGEKVAAVRRKWERGWGCHNLELPVSRLAGTTAFAVFVGHLVSDLPRFHAAYNAAVRTYRSLHGLRSRSHPVPDLTRDGDWFEVPFWAWRHGPHTRRRLTARLRPVEWGVDLQLEKDGPPVGTWDPARNPDDWLRSWRQVAALGYRVRPRALTLTLFARLVLGDYFVHGIGGGKYDEVTDALIRDYFGVAPPRFGVLSATLHLPLPGFPDAADKVRALSRCERDLYWNPQRHGAAGKEKAMLAAAEPGDRAGRRKWFHDLQAATDRLRPLVVDELADVRRRLARSQREADAHADLRRRDFAWVLFPEDGLGEFLRSFLG